MLRYSADKADAVPFQEAQGLYFDSGKDFTFPAAWSYPATVCPEDEACLYELIPRQWRTKVDNLDHALGMLVFDLWMGSNRPRHSIYRRDGEHIRVEFISHGEMFYHWRGIFHYAPPQTLIRQLVWRDRDLYQRWDNARVLWWASKVNSLAEETLDDALVWVGEHMKPPHYDEEVRGFLGRRKANFETNVALICSALESYSERGLT